MESNKQETEFSYSMRDGDGALPNSIYCSAASIEESKDPPAQQDQSSECEFEQMLGEAYNNLNDSIQSISKI